MLDSGILWYVRGYDRLTAQIPQRAQSFHFFPNRVQPHLFDKRRKDLENNGLQVGQARDDLLCNFAQRRWNASGMNAPSGSSSVRGLR